MTWEKISLLEMLERKWITSHLDGNHGSNYPRKAEFIDSGIPYISANCIRNNTVDLSRAKYLSKERANSLRKGIAKNRDVIFAHNATVGPVSVLSTEEPKVILGTSLTYYRCDETHILPEYLALYMQSTVFVEQYSAVMRQSTRNQVPITKQREFFHLVPSVEEQKLIVTILDKAFVEIEQARALAEKNLNNARELFESYLQQVFSQRGEGWAETTLGEIASVSSGGTPLKSNQTFWNGDIPWYSSGELNDTFTVAPKDMITNAGLVGSNAKLFPKGALLIGMYDTAALKMSILDRDGAFNQAIAGVKPNDSINLEFVLHSINYIKPELLKLRRGVRQKNLNQSKIKGIPLRVPPIEKQAQIVNELKIIKQKVDCLSRIYTIKQKKLDELKKSILQQAFSGQLTSKEVA